MTKDKGKNESGGRKGGSSDKDNGNGKPVVKRPGDNLHGNNGSTNSTGPRSPSNGKDQQ